MGQEHFYGYAILSEPGHHGNGDEVHWFNVDRQGSEVFWCTASATLWRPRPVSTIDRHGPRFPNSRRSRVFRTAPDSTATSRGRGGPDSGCPKARRSLHRGPVLGQLRPWPAAIAAATRWAYKPPALPPPPCARRVR